MEREPLIPGGEPVCFVGGYVMITRVDPTGVHMSKGLSFPDEIGRRIDTSGDVEHLEQWAASAPGSATPPPGMNRQQKLAWEAAQRKKGGGQVRPVS